MSEHEKISAVTDMPSIPIPRVPLASTVAREKRCPSCGGTDHLRSSNRRCKNYQKKSRPTITVRENFHFDTHSEATQNDVPATPQSTNKVPGANKKSLWTRFSPGIRIEVPQFNIFGDTRTQDNDEMKEETKNFSSNELEDNKEDISTAPFYIPLVSECRPDKDQATYKPVFDLDGKEFINQDKAIKFGIRKNQRGPPQYHAPSIEKLVDLFFPMKFMEEVVTNSTSYIQNRKQL